LKPKPLTASQCAILVVDDESSVRRVLSVTLSGMGFTVVAASRGEEAVALVRVSRFDAVLLDVDMPGMSGVETCRNIRRSNACLPILMLTAMDSENDQVMGLDAGADDYITKPFRIRELAARLRSAVRRGNAQDHERAAPIRHGQLELDIAKYRVQKGGLPIHLTPKEFEMLHYLMIHAGEVISQEQLLKSVWGTEYGNESEYLRVYVSQLRKKIEDDPLNPKYLVTVPRIGYRFNERQCES
jgi:two-component system, OmpR family, KDP operon response regulator KdpE